MSESAKVPHIKSDAKVDITILSGTIIEVQNVLSYILEGHSQADLETFQTKVTTGAKLLPWESSAFSIIRLLKVIYDSATASDQVIYKDLAESLTSAVQ